MLADHYKKADDGKDKNKNTAVDYQKLSNEKTKLADFHKRKEESREKWDAAADAKRFDLKKKEEERKKRELSTKKIMLESAAHLLKRKKEEKDALLAEARELEAAGSDPSEKRAAAESLDHDIAAAKSEEERLEMVVKKMEVELGARGFSEDV